MSKIRRPPLREVDFDKAALAMERGDIEGVLAAFHVVEISADMKPEIMPAEVLVRGQRIRVGSKLKKRGPRNRNPYHVRGFLDDQVVLRQWWKHKQYWYYTVESVDFLNMAFEVLP